MHRLFRYLHLAKLADLADQGPGWRKGFRGSGWAEGQGRELEHQREGLGQHGDPPAGNVASRDWRGKGPACLIYYLK